MAAIQYVSHAPTILTVPLFAGCFLLISVIVGRRTMLLVGATRSTTASESAVIAVATGAGLLQFVPFFLGAVHLLSDVSVRIAFGIIGLACVRDLPVLAAAAGRWRSRRRQRARWEWVWLALVTFPLVFSLLTALSPSVDPDGVGYHLTAPKRWLEIGSLDFLPTLTYTSGVMGTEMLYSVALSFVGDSGAKLLHLSCGILAAYGVFLLGSRIGSTLVGRIGCVLFLFGPFGVYSIAGVAYADSTAAFAAICATLCWVLWLKSEDTAWLRMAALLSGIAVSFKLTSVLIPLALTILTVLIIRKQTAAAKDRPVQIAPVIAALVAMPMLPWFVRSCIVVGNPVFPVLARWIPSRDFPPSIASKFESYNRYQLWGSRWGDSLGLDARRLIIGLAALACITIGFFLMRRLRDPVHRTVAMVVVITVVVQLMAAGLYLRYWIPLAAVVQVPLIAVVLGRLNRRVLGVGLFALTVGLVAFSARSELAGSPIDLARSAVSEESRREFLNDHIPTLKLVRIASDLTAPGDAVLMTEMCLGFYVDGPSMCTGLSDALGLTSWSEFIHDVDDLHITYLIAPLELASGGRPQFGNGSGSVSAVVVDKNFEMVSRLIVERGRLLETADGWGVFSLSEVVAGPVE